MAKIDLCDPKWVDMVFADKNKEYGAYKLRKTVSQRNIKAFAILLCAAFLGGGYLAYQIKKHNDELAAQAEYAAKMELAALEQAKKEQAERKKQANPASYPDSIYQAELSAIKTGMINGKKVSTMTVIIKPTDQASYRHLVDILDEMQISYIGTYVIDKLTDQDKALLAKKGIKA